jgi:hypothetical protein
MVAAVLPRPPCVLRIAKVVVLTVPTCSGLGMPGPWQFMQVTLLSAWAEPLQLLNTVVASPPTLRAI